MQFSLTCNILWCYYFDRSCSYGTSDPHTCTRQMGHHKETQFVAARAICLPRKWTKRVAERGVCSVWVCGMRMRMQQQRKKGNKRKAALAILIYVGRRRFAKLLNAASGIRTGNQKAEQEMAVGKCWENGEPNGCRKAADRGLQITLKYSSRLKQWLRTRPFVRTCT